MNKGYKRAKRAISSLFLSAMRSADNRTWFVRQVEKRKSPKDFFLRQSLIFSERAGEFLQRKKRVQPLPSARAQYFGFAKSSIVCILFLSFHYLWWSWICFDFDFLHYFWWLDFFISFFVAYYVCPKKKGGFR